VNIFWEALTAQNIYWNRVYVGGKHGFRSKTKKIGLTPLILAIIILNNQNCHLDFIGDTETSKKQEYFATIARIPINLLFSRK